MKYSEDEKWMKIAISEGRKGLGLTSPNPPVGAVIVKNGVELARGWHRMAGAPHAEKDALSKLSPDETVGATVYVSLEPCSTVGRTGACSTSLIEARVSRVVYGCQDPNPSHAGAADRVFEEAGITVTSGILERECRALIRGFACVVEKGRPWVIAKTAVSLDGKITRPPGEGQWLTGVEAREEVHLLRGEVDAILTSGETVRRDDPALTIRSDKVFQAKLQPWRVILTEKGIDPLGYQVFSDQFSDRTVVFEDRRHEEVLRELARDYDVSVVLIEAGGDLLGSFLDAGLVDEWVSYLAPIVSGGSKLGLGGTGVERLDHRVVLGEVSFERFGDDVLARGLVERNPIQPLPR